jgi:hypothetical protein
MSVKKEGKTYYTKFHDIEGSSHQSISAPPSHPSFSRQFCWVLIVIYHVSVMMGAEGHRRLIGNDVCTIFFRDEGSEPFDVASVTNLGTMPQIFILVQPKGDKYMISSFSRKTIKPYAPAIPKNHLFTLKEAKGFILTKCASLIHVLHSKLFPRANPRLCSAQRLYSSHYFLSSHQPSVVHTQKRSPR